MVHLFAISSNILEWSTWGICIIKCNPSNFQFVIYLF